MRHGFALGDPFGMRSVVLVVVLATAANAGPIARIGGVGGYDTTAPGHRDDGYALAAGYRFAPITVALEYAYLDYDGTAGYGGESSRLGALIQTQLVSATCRPGRTCPHLDFDLGIGRRWVRWEPQEWVGYNLNLDPVIERQGREVSIGLSATFGLRFALHYVLFTPDAAPPVSCRGVCPMRTAGDAPAVLFEAGFTVGG